MRPRLYSELADWWALVSPVADYAAAAELYAALLRDERRATSELAALELGSGGGHCAWTLSDVSREHPIHGDGGVRYAFVARRPAR